MGKFRGLARNSAAHKKLWAPVIINLDHMTPFNCKKNMEHPLDHTQVLKSITLQSGSYVQKVSK